MPFSCLYLSPVATSLIVPTVDRVDDLARCLASVARLRPGFDEVIVVGQGDEGRTREVLARFPDLPVTLLRSEALSLPRARNVGIERARGDCLFFVDDDTELPPGYVAAALDAFKRHPEAVGLTGTAVSAGATASAGEASARTEDAGPRTHHTGCAGVPSGCRRRRPENAPRSGRVRRWAGIGVPERLKHALYALLLVYSWRRNRVLRSGSASFAHGAAAGQPHEAEWLHGCNCVYRRRVFDDGFRFDEDRLGWARDEDVDLSYRVHKRYGRGSLRFEPALSLTHHSGADHADRLESPEAMIRMKVVYRYIFWRLEVYGGSPLNLLCYLWGQPGFVLFHLLNHLRARRRWRILRAAASAYLYLLRRPRAAVEDRAATNRFVLRGAGGRQRGGSLAPAENFAAEADRARPSFLAEIWAFMAVNKKWWLLPIIVVLSLFGVLLWLSSTAVAPFIYPLF